MNKKKRKIIIAILISIFFIINVVWYIGVLRPYVKLYLNMLDDPYYKKDSTTYDEDGYTCSICYPTYLLWESGNLSVCSPLVSDESVQTENTQKAYTSMETLIVWFDFFSGDIKEIGIILTLDGETRYIYLEDSGTARDKVDQSFVDEGQEIIDTLFKKTEDTWNIEMPWKK